MKIFEIVQRRDQIIDPELKKELMDKIWVIIDNKFQSRINDEIIAVACNKVARNEYKKLKYFDAKSCANDLKYIFSNRSDGAHRKGQYFDNDTLAKVTKTVKSAGLQNTRISDIKQKQDPLKIT